MSPCKDCCVVRLQVGELCHECCILKHSAAVFILYHCKHLTCSECPLWIPAWAGFLSSFGRLTGSICATVTTTVSLRPSGQVCHVGPLSIGTKNSWGHYIYKALLVTDRFGRDWSVGMTTSGPPLYLWEHQLCHIGPLSIGTKSVNRSIHSSAQHYILHTHETLGRITYVMSVVPSWASV